MLICRTYKDLDHLFIGINKEFATDPDTMAIKKTSMVIYGKPFYMEADSPRFTLNISKLQYGNMKFNRLKKDYIDQEELKFFKNKIQDQKGLSCTFYFNKRKEKRGASSNNGPCLIAIVLTRESRSSKWEQATVYYRASQINRIFGVDLLLISKFIKELPECCEIKKISIFIPNPFHSISYLPVQEKLFGFTKDDIIGQENKERYQGIVNRFYMGQHSNYAVRNRMQMAYYGERVWKKIDQESLTLEDKT